MNGNKKYLYHYCTIETLKLILKNRTIRFNSLGNVDDLYECQTADLGSAGKMIFVSCWTRNPEENTELWKSYTNYHGVRIKVFENPFVEYYIPADTCFNSEEIFSNFDHKNLIHNQDICIVPSKVMVVDVEYTNDEDLLIPTIINGPKDLVEKFKSARSQEEFLKFAWVHYPFINEFGINLSKIGKYKQLAWRGQNETRYLFLVNPYGMGREWNSFKSQQKQLRMITDPNLDLKISHYDLKITQEALDDLEVMCGPKVSAEEKEEIEELLKNYAPKATLTSSKLKVR